MDESEQRVFTLKEVMDEYESLGTFDFEEHDNPNFWLRVGKTTLRIASVFKIHNSDEEDPLIAEVVDIDDEGASLRINGSSELVHTKQSRLVAARELVTDHKVAGAITTSVTAISVAGLYVWNRHRNQ